MAISVRTKILACAVCWGTLGSTFAQQYGFVQYTPQDGLAQSQVRCIAQDAQGFLWFGTLGGASRFDGKQFTNYALQEGLPDAQVISMLSGSDGRMWLGTGSGLVRSLNGRSPVPIQLPGLQAPRIMALAEDGMGRVYMATDEFGVLVYAQGVVAPLEGLVSDSLQGSRVLLCMPDGALLIGARNGLVRWKDGEHATVSILDGLPKSISALALGRDGSIWVGTFGDGVFRLLPDGRIKEYDESSGLLQNNIRSLLVDDQDRVWVGTKFGANLIERGRVRAFTVHQGLQNDNIWCVFQDRDGGIWLGSDGAGVMRYTGDRFVTFTQKDGLCSDQIMCIVADDRNDLWLGTYGNGICRLDGMAMVTTLDGVPNNTVWCGTRDDQGRLWFGTSDGLCVIENGLVVPLTGPAALRGERVLSLLKDPDGSIWCGTREGAYHIIDGVRVEPVDLATEGAARSVRAIYRAGNGALWFAHELGLSVVDKNGSKHVTLAKSSASKVVFCLAEDPQGRMWAGTSNGLACVTDSRTVIVRPGPDFGSNYIDLLIADDAGALWAGTNNGLFRFFPDSLLKDASKATHFTLNDGLRSLECNLNAAYRDPHGKLLIGTAAGLVLHDPDRSERQGSTDPPALFLTAVRSYLQPTDWSTRSDSISFSTGLPVLPRIDPRRNYLTFDYAGISLSTPEKVRYRYRLLGLDDDWFPPTDARFASYSNLPQGDYTFQVVSSLQHGSWGPPAELRFIVLPPFWATWWFFLLVGTALGSLLFGIMRYRRIRRARHERTRQLMLRSRMLQLEQQALNANMNRHFVFNALNSIQYYINRQDRSTANKYLTSFAKLIRKNLDASQSDTTTLAEELERLELYLLLEHMRFKDKFQYRLEVAQQVDTHGIRIPAMMLQPYVENSIWHGILPMSIPGTVLIAVQQGGTDQVVVEITDDGIGVEESRATKNGSGDHISRGIAITKGRADVLRDLNVTDIRITGPLQLRDAEGKVKGTRVTIELHAHGPSPFGGASLQKAHDRTIFEQQ